MPSLGETIAVLKENKKVISTSTGLEIKNTEKLKPTLTKEESDELDESITSTN